MKHVIDERAIQLTGKKHPLVIEMNELGDGYGGWCAIAYTETAAKRITDSVNACKGIKDPVKVIPLLLAAMERTVTDLEDFCDGDGEFQWSKTAGLKMIREARAALAAAKGV